MVDKIVNPFFNYFIRILFKKLFKVLQFTACQWIQTSYWFDLNSYNLAFNNAELCLTFIFIIFCMNMYWFKLIRVEKIRIPRYSKIFGIKKTFNQIYKIFVSSLLTRYFRKKSHQNYSSLEGTTSY